MARKAMPIICAVGHATITEAARDTIRDTSRDAAFAAVTKALGLKILGTSTEATNDVIEVATDFATEGVTFDAIYDVRFNL